MPPSRDSYANNFPKPDNSIDISGLELEEMSPKGPGASSSVELSPDEAEELRQKYAAVSLEQINPTPAVTVEAQSLTQDQLNERQKVDIEELFGDGYNPAPETISTEGTLSGEALPVKDLDVLDSNNPEIAEALEYIGSSSNQSYSDILRAWKDKMYSNNQSARRYGYAGLIGGGTTLASGIAASALGYTAVGTGLAFGAPAVILGGGALWAGKKIYNKWKGRRVAEKLKLHQEDLEG